MNIDDDVHPEAAVAPGYLANHATRIFNRAVDAALRPHGLSLALIGPILLLDWKGPMLQRDLVRHSAVKQPAMAALLDKLEDAGLIARARKAEDRRASLVTLTAKGQKAAAVGGAALRSANAIGMAGLDPEEARRLVGLMQRFIDGLEAAAGTIHHE